MKIELSKYILTSIIILNVIFAKAENYLTYYNLINKAEWAAFNNNDKVAIDYYLKALTRFESKVDYYHYEDAVNLLIKNKNYKKAVFLMRKAVRMFGYFHEDNLKIQDCKEKKWLKSYIKYNKNYLKDKKFWKSNLDINSIRLYSYIMATDQYPRTLNNYIRLSSYETDSLKIEDIRHEMRNRTDSINKLIFKEHYQHYGYPGLNVSGGINNWYAFYAHTLS